MIVWDVFDTMFTCQGGGESHVHEAWGTSTRHLEKNIMAIKRECNAKMKLGDCSR